MKKKSLITITKAQLADLAMLSAFGSIQVMTQDKDHERLVRFGLARRIGTPEVVGGYAITKMGEDHLRRCRIL